MSGMVQVRVRCENCRGHGCPGCDGTGSRIVDVQRWTGGWASAADIRMEPGA